MRVKVEIRTKNAWQQAKHAWLFIDLLQDLKGDCCGEAGRWVGGGGGGV